MLRQADVGPAARGVVQPQEEVHKAGGVTAGTDRAGRVAPHPAPAHAMAPTLLLLGEHPVLRCTRCMAL